MKNKDELDPIGLIDLASHVAPTWNDNLFFTATLILEKCIYCLMTSCPYTRIEFLFTEKASIDAP